MTEKKCPNCRSDNVVGFDDCRGAHCNACKFRAGIEYWDNLNAKMEELEALKRDVLSLSMDASNMSEFIAHIEKENQQLKIQLTHKELDQCPKCKDALDNQGMRRKLERLKLVIADGLEVDFYRQENLQLVSKAEQLKAKLAMCEEWIPQVEYNPDQKVYMLCQRIAVEEINEDTARRVSEYFAYYLSTKEGWYTQDE